MPPRDLPCWRTMYWWLRPFVRRLLFHIIHDIVLVMDRQLRKRAPQSSAELTLDLSRQPLNKEKQHALD